MPQKIRDKIIRIGTRGSPLALWQAREVARLLKISDPFISIKEIIIKTSGDKFLPPLCKGRLGGVEDLKGGVNYSGKGLFVKEIEEALLAGRIDIAVHSLKDVPAFLPKGLQITAYLKREDAYDLFISERYKDINDMPKGAVFGTSSPRRAAQVLALRPDIKIIPLRGNVETRIRKMREGVCDATILACAGINRLGLSDRLMHLRTLRLCSGQAHALKHFIPAIGQGMICIESRKKDAKLAKFLRKVLNHRGTEISALAERTFLQKVGGDCHTPIAAHCTQTGNSVTLTALVASPDGRKMIKMSRKGRDGVKTAGTLAEKFIKLGARKMMGLEKNVLDMPLIAVKDPSDGGKSMNSAVKKINEYDWLTFTSKNGVEKFFTRCHLPAKIKIAVVGPATADKLRSYGLKADLIPKKDFSSKGLAEEFAKLNMKGKNVLFPRAKEGRDTLIMELKKQGAKVTLVEAYRTMPAKINVKKWERIFEKELPFAIKLSSPSAVNAYLKAFGKKYFKKGMKISCIGNTTKSSAISKGLKDFLLP